MKRRIAFVFFSLLSVSVIALTAVPLRSVHAQDGSQSAGGVIMTDHYELRSGDVYNGNLVVLAREIDLQAGSRVMGNATLYASGSASISGAITGNLVVIAPQVTLTATAQGNVTVCTSNLAPLSDLSIKGSVTVGCDLAASLSSLQTPSASSTSINDVSHSLGSGRQGVPPLTTPNIVSRLGVADDYDYLLSRVWALLSRVWVLLTTTLATSALAGLGSAAFPRQMRRARDSILIRPATAALVGFLGGALALGVTVIYALSLMLIVTVVLLPVILLGWVALGGLLFAGWIVIAEPIGRIILGRMRVYPVPMAAAAVGAFVMTFGIGLLMMIPCVGWIGSLAFVTLGSAGLGSLILTRLGRQTYPPLAAPTIRLV